MMQKLWGDNYFDAKGNKWTKNGRRRLEARARVLPVHHGSDLQDVRRGHERQEAQDREDAQGVGVELKPDDKDSDGQAAAQAVMRKWIPASDAVLEMIVVHLPSPVTAQRTAWRRCTTARSTTRRPTAIRNVRDGPHGAADDVRIEDGARGGPRPLLRLRPRVLGPREDGPEGAHPGPQLRRRARRRTSGSRTSSARSS